MAVHQFDKYLTGDTGVSVSYSYDTEALTMSEKRETENSGHVKVRKVYITESQRERLDMLDSRDNKTAAEIFYETLFD